MPLDHYVSQVHLKKFYSPMLGNRMYAMRKSDLKVFTPRSEDVCRILDGSTNAYLRENRLIEEFLKTVEPNYNLALHKLATRDIDAVCIYTIAGFVAYVTACSPAAMRLSSGPLRGVVETTSEMMEVAGELPPPPASLAGTGLVELLQRGVVDITIDPKYPQAIGINTIVKRVALFGNFRWEILHNESKETPFFTSDFPAAIQVTYDRWIFNRIVPLAPDLAVRIKPNPKVDRSRLDLSFANFAYRVRKVGREEAMKFNRAIVRCAENAVFYRDDRPWIEPFVSKNRQYRIEPLIIKRQTAKGVLQISTHRVVGRPPRTDWPQPG
jgi:Protein of unknown function (DUF4238)